MITIETNTFRLIEMRGGLVWLGANVTGLAAQVVRDVTAETHDAVVSGLTQEINAPSLEIEQRVYSQDPKQMTFATVSASVGLKSWPIPIRRFGAMQTTAGVTYQPYTSGGRKLIPGTFGPAIRLLGRGVFRRVGKRRLPIVRQPGMQLTKDPVAKQIMKSVQARVPGMIAKHLKIRFAPLDMGHAFTDDWRRQLPIGGHLQRRVYGIQSTFSRTGSR